ncbi:MAG: VOC family protein [Paracoccaceae bacterium]
MSHPVKGVDHAFIMVDDLDDAAERYRALGFTLSPRGLHSAAKGSANYTIMFPEDYFELLGILAPTPGNAPRRAMLEKCGQGLHAVACRIDDAAKGAASLGELGIATYGLGDFQRPVPLPGGGEGIAAFSTVSFAPEEVPTGIVFMCQHKTRETVWLPELMTHANTAIGLDAVIARSSAPEADGARMARLFAAGNVKAEGGVAEVTTGPNSAPILMMDEAALAAAYPGVDLAKTPTGAFTALRLRVSDLSAAIKVLAKAGIPHSRTSRGVAAAPEACSGAIIEFVPAG